jgi:hypothetical protein
MLRQVLVIFFLLGWAVASAQPGPVKVFVAIGKQVQIQTLSPGTWGCEGGQTTTTGPPFCSPGTKKIYFTYMSTKYSMQDVTGSAADLLAGENVTAVHGVFDANYFGHMWGHFEWTVPAAEGRWQGSFTSTADQTRGLNMMKAVGYGSGGKLEGLKLEFYYVNSGSGQPAYFVAQVTTR